MGDCRQVNKIDKLTKLTHFLPVKITYGYAKLMKLFIREIVQLLMDTFVGLSEPIVSL